jgi:AraC-like DNA-binding protein
MKILDKSSEDNSNIKSWSTTSLNRDDRVDKWSEMLSDSHLPWTISEIPSKEFSADLSVRSFSNYKLINCACDTFKGYRKSQEIGNTNEAYFCILLLQNGQEKITIRGEDLYLKKNDIILWDSTQKMSFHVPDHIQKTSLLFPATGLTSIFPKAHDYAGSIIPGESSIGGMLARHMDSLQKEMWRLETASLTSLMKPTMEILATALTGNQIYSPSSMRTISLQRVKQYILNNLQDYTLSPTTVSENVGISIRYLHMLFERENTTVNTWIKQCRLHRCKDEICSTNINGKTITEIAFNWGFNDISHFSKVFKKEFGHSPRSYAQKIINATDI